MSRNHISSTSTEQNSHYEDKNCMINEYTGVLLTTSMGLQNVFIPCWPELSFVALCHYDHSEIYSNLSQARSILITPFMLVRLNVLSTRTGYLAAASHVLLLIRSWSFPQRGILSVVESKEEPAKLNHTVPQVSSNIHQMKIHILWTVI